MESAPREERPESTPAPRPASVGAASAGSSSGGSGNGGGGVSLIETELGGKLIEEIEHEPSEGF